MPDNIGTIAGGSFEGELPANLRCGFCSREIDDVFYRTFNRFACADCARDAEAEARKNHFNTAAFARACLAGFCWWVLASTGFALAERFLPQLIVLAAILIGMATGKIVRAAASNRRGNALQWLAAPLGGVAVIFGNFLWFAWMLAEAAKNDGVRLDSTQFRTALIRNILLRPNVFLSPIDALWIGISAYIAWRICRPVRIDVAGPYAYRPAVDGSAESSDSAQPLDQLAAEARWQEQFNPKMAVVLWEQCLQLLPPDSSKSLAIQREIDRLVASPRPTFSIEEPSAIPPIRTETFTGGLWKTSLSMLVSILFYAADFHWNWPIAIGFVLLILVHELGHVIANVFYGVPISAPIFIPFIGAVINLRQPPANAKIEALCAIAGPIAGTIGALFCFGWYCYDHSALALTLAWFGFTINLFNLLPLPPLDGGRVAAAISPWIWLVGLAGMGAMLVDEFRSGGGPGILVIVLIVALPRVIKTLKSGGRTGRYYQIGRIAPVAIGAAYLLLLAALIVLRLYSQNHMADRPMM